MHMSLIYLLIIRQFCDVFSFESNYGNEGTTGSIYFNQNTQQSIYSGSGIYSQILNSNKKENPVLTQTSNKPISSYPNIPLNLNYESRGELNYSTLFKPYVISPLNFDAFSFYDNNTSKDTNYVSTLQQNLNLKTLLGPPNSLGVNQNEVFGLIPKATIESVPVPPVSEYNKRPENDYIVDDYIVKVKEVALPSPHVAKYEPQFEDEVKEKPNEKIVENANNFLPKRPESQQTSTTTGKPQMNDKLKGPPLSKPSNPEKNEELRGPPPPTPRPHPKTSSTPPSNDRPQPTPTSNSDGPYQYSPQDGPPPHPSYPSPDDYHSPCVYSPYYNPSLDCRPSYPPLYPTKAYEGPERHFTRARIMDNEPAHTPYPSPPITDNKPPLTYEPNNHNYNEDEYHPSLTSLPPNHIYYHSHQPQQPFHQNIHQTDAQLYSPDPTPVPYQHSPNPYPYHYHKHASHLPSGPYQPNDNNAANNQIIYNNYRNPNRPLPHYSKSIRKHEYRAQPKINNIFRPITKCQMRIPARLLPHLKLSSGAPFPPNLDQYYRPIRYNPNEPLKVFWKQFDGLSCHHNKIQIINSICSKNDKNCTQFNPSKTMNFKKLNESDDWTPTPDDPVYKFMESEHKYQAVVPEEVPQNYHNSNIDEETKRIRDFKWTGISGRSYDSYAFLCKGKVDGFYADFSYNCQVYYKCLNYGIDKKYKCPKGMRFNQSIQKCVWSQRVICGA